MPRIPLIVSGIILAAQLPLLAADLLPAGNIRRMLHLGTAETDRITGFPTSGQSIHWDYIRYAGKGGEEQLQPRPGQTVDVLVAATQSPLVWTDVTAINAGGVWAQNAGDNYVMYWAIYIYAPTTRDAKLTLTCPDYTRGFMDGNQAFLFDLLGNGSSATFSLTQGWHSFIFKMHARAHVDHFAIKFVNPDNSDMTDLQYTLDDPIAPRMGATVPAAGATGVPRSSDVVVRFTEAMDTSVDPATVARIEGGASGTWAWGSPFQLVWTPAAPLNEQATYEVILTGPNAKDLAGNALAGTESFVFTTETVVPLTVSTADMRYKPGVLKDVVVTGAGFEAGRVIRPPAAEHFNGHYYQFYTTQTDWHAAQALLAANDGHLATPTTAAENLFVWRLGAWTNFWFGLTDEVTEGQYRWVTGETFAYSNWAPGEPADLGGEDYGIFWWGVGWNDVGSTVGAMRPYVGEFESRPVPAVKITRAGEADIIATNVRWISSTELRVDLDITSAAHGAWDLTVSNPSGGEATDAGAIFVDNVAPRITGMSPAAAATVNTLITEITVTADEPLDAATINNGSVRLYRRGADGIYGTGDDVRVLPAGITLADPVTIKLDLTGVTLVSDIYHVVLGRNAVTGTLAASYGFDENSGSTAADGSANGRHAAINGADWISGVHGSALKFIAGDEATINAADIDPPWTVSAWVQVTDSINAELLISPTYFLKLNQNPHTGKMGFTRLAVADYLFNYELPKDNTWTHVTWVGTSGNTSLYVNGVFQQTLNNSIKAPLQKIRPGNNGGVGVDELRVYSSALAAGDIPELLKSGLTDSVGWELDGEFSGTFPSGNGSASGEFNASFTVIDPPVGDPATFNLSEDGVLTDAVTGSGTGTLNFAVAVNPTKGNLNLQPNGSFVYTPNQDANGSDTFKFTVTDDSGPSLQATATINIAPVQDAPVLQSAAAANPQTAFVNQTVQFSAAATDVDGDTLTHSWDFGDGVVLVGPNKSHKYAAAGVYTVTVTISDGQTAPLTSSVNVTIIALPDPPSPPDPPTIPPDNDPPNFNPPDADGDGVQDKDDKDDDNDGISDSIEAALGMDPKAPNTPGTLNVTKWSGAVDFKSISKSKAGLSAIVPGVAALPQQATLMLADAGIVFIVDKKGRAKNSNGSLQLKVSKPKKGGQAALTLKATLKAGAFAPAWIDGGIVSDEGAASSSAILVLLQLDGTIYSASVQTEFSFKNGAAKFKQR